MLFNVPQYIDVEDKIAGPLTAKQLLWMAGMGAILLVLWNILEQTFFIISAIPVVVIFLALAFYRPYNQPLIKFIFSGFIFLFRPKIYSWQRGFATKTVDEGRAKSKTGSVQKKEKKVTAEQIKELAKVIDSGGMIRVERPALAQNEEINVEKETPSKETFSFPKIIRKKSAPVVEGKKDEEIPAGKEPLRNNPPPTEQDKEAASEEKIIFFN